MGRQDLPLKNQEDVLLAVHGFQDVGEAHDPLLGDLREVADLLGLLKEQVLLDVGHLRRELLLLQPVEIPHHAPV